jgi:hypothetical protein
VWTRFYQGVYLVQKFGFDKRRAHLSTLINSGQLSREEALRRLGGEVYASELMIQDRNFVLKKFGLTEESYDALLQAPSKSHLDFPTLDFLYLRTSGLLEFFRKTAKSV